MEKLTKIVRGISKREFAVFDYSKDLDWRYLIFVVRGRHKSNHVYTRSMPIHFHKRITRKTIGLILEDSNTYFFDEVNIDRDLWKEKDIKAIWDKISDSFMGTDPNPVFRYPKNAYIIN